MAFRMGRRTWGHHDCAGMPDGSPRQHSGLRKPEKPSARPCERGTPRRRLPSHAASLRVRGRFWERSLLWAAHDGFSVERHATGGFPGRSRMTVLPDVFGEIIRQGVATGGPTGATGFQRPFESRFPGRSARGTSGAGSCPSRGATCGGHKGDRLLFWDALRFDGRPYAAWQCGRGRFGVSARGVRPKTPSRGSMNDHVHYPRSASRWRNGCQPRPTRVPPSSRKIGTAFWMGRRT